MPPKFTLPLDEIDASQAAIGGGKGASLGELIRAGLGVPPGFVVTRPAFDTFMNVADPHGEVSAWLAKVDSNETSTATAAKAIAELSGSAPVPAEIEAEIVAAIDTLNVPIVSVRSSATCEDGKSSAWAGQLETYLDVEPGEVVARVKDCWLSMFRTAALAYGAAHGYGAGQFGVAVVVQEMIFSEVSGIGFSVHPVTQEPDVRLIEACFGLGEAIVSGQIVPDQYIVKKGGDQIVESSRGEQRKGLFLAHGQSEPEWRDLGARGTEPKLTDSQVVEYGALLDRIEDHYGFPVDTEWAYTESGFHLLQARPITTLAKEYRDPIVDQREAWWRGFRRPLTLLEASIIAHWTDTRHSGLVFGFHINRFLAIEDDSNLTTMFFPKSDFDAATDHIRSLDQTDRLELIALLKRAHEVYQEGFDRIHQSRGFTTIDGAAEYLITIGRYTTSLPAMTLMALDAGHIDDKQVRELAEGLRAHSLYPRFVARHVDPIVANWARDIGFSEPGRAHELVTWRELHDNSVDCKTLEQRLELVDNGKLFVFQVLEEGERLDFVSETGYLFMREAGQRMAVPPDDPDVISGRTAWPGVHRGRARVILSSEPEGYELEDGDVLVSIQSNPTLMPLLRHAGAIVTDEGGVACHAGIICRELKIPTIIGTGRATSAIHDGDLVEVDAIAQVVRILEHAEREQPAARTATTHRR